MAFFYVKKKRKKLSVTRGKRSHLSGHYYCSMGGADCRLQGVEVRNGHQVLDRPTSVKYVLLPHGA
jgi:hypothetical protein